jgi:hypothetical protein
VPDIADLASVVLRRCYERVETGEATVTIRDAVAILRLPNEIERTMPWPSGTPPSAR